MEHYEVLVELQRILSVHPLFSKEKRDAVDAIINMVIFFKILLNINLTIEFY